MTTIAWDGKTLAADSLAHGEFKLRVCKLHRLASGEIFGAAGSCQEILAVLAWLHGGGDKPLDLECFEGLIVAPSGGAEVLGTRLMRNPVLDPFYALGSGAPFAIAAMACGKTAAEAVRVAIRFDPGSGGRVQTMKLEQSGRRRK